MSVVATLPEEIRLSLQHAHPSWHAVLEQGLLALQQAQPAYLTELCAQPYLPTQHRLFAAFSVPRDQVRYVLIGEGPYPREQSATGVSFMDGAVSEIWSSTGLSKKVNRATSLRNFFKMLLVADGYLDESATTGDAMQGVAQIAGQANSPLIQHLDELQQKMQQQGFLLLNASLVFRDHVAPVKDGQSWLPFLQVVLHALAQTPSDSAPALVLWGKIAEQVRKIPEASCFTHIIAEHPYNLSFIGNKQMQDFFRPMQLLKSFSLEK
ncbi:uracil-DNA glycosylase [Undibacterium sp. CY7W]|uniref:Uracil-DNA glycosylase n=1 Tax=Undibacterium rugosum TaxID=2762291 RepID=A0A923I1V0_9BURK|nr:uracil-DNA glycosylase [Undibacterium rugosum]MBC3934962.1 uracil-DNA glycosylase [Undibacterium rugosum]